MEINMSYWCKAVQYSFSNGQLNEQNMLSEEVTACDTMFTSL